jgi:hypothetical protein
MESLVPVAVFAKGTWTGCFPQDSQVLWLDQPSPATPEQQKREARILPATPVP